MEIVQYKHHTPYSINGTAYNLCLLLQLNPPGENATLLLVDGIPFIEWLPDERLAKATHIYCKAKPLICYLVRLVQVRYSIKHTDQTTVDENKSSGYLPLIDTAGKRH